MINSALVFRTCHHLRTLVHGRTQLRRLSSEDPAPWPFHPGSLKESLKVPSSYYDESRKGPGRAEELTLALDRDLKEAEKLRKLGKPKEKTPERTSEFNWWQVFRSLGSYPTRYIFVANVPFTALPKDLLQIFEPFKVQRIDLGVTESEYSLGRALLEFASVEEAAWVLSTSNDFWCGSRRLQLTPSRPHNEPVYEYLPPSDTLTLRYFTADLPNVRQVIKKVLHEHKEHIVDFYEIRQTNLAYIQFETIEHCKAALKAIRVYCIENPLDSHLLVMFSTLERPRLDRKSVRWREGDDEELKDKESAVGMAS